jgi:hypothetical protein
LTGDRIWALTFLRHFQVDGAAMQQLRSLPARFQIPGRGITDGEMLEQLSWLFNSGRVHACRIERKPPPPVRSLAAAAAPPFPLVERKPPVARQPDLDADTFPFDADLVAGAAAGIMPGKTPAMVTAIALVDRSLVVQSLALRVPDSGGFLTWYLAAPPPGHEILMLRRISFQGNSRFDSYAVCRAKE